MGLLHSNLPFRPPLGRAIERFGEVPGHTYPDGMEKRIKGRKSLSALRDRRRVLEENGRFSGK